MEYKVTDIITLLNAEYKGEVIESVSKLSPFFHSDEKSLTFAADEKFLKNLAQTRAKVIKVIAINVGITIKMRFKINENINR